MFVVAGGGGTDRGGVKFSWGIALLVLTVAVGVAVVLWTHSVGGCCLIVGRGRVPGL